MGGEKFQYHGSQHDKQLFTPFKEKRLPFLKETRGKVEPLLKPTWRSMINPLAQKQSAGRVSSQEGTESFLCLLGLGTRPTVPSGKNAFWKP